MIFVDNQNITDPRLNLALEEYLLRHVRLDEPILLFYVNQPAVIVGRNQNVWEEIDLTYVETNDIDVVRRLSGGGAVYHDLGNLNFSFISTGSENLHNFRLFTEPVIRVLNEWGVPAALHGKSDIYAGGKKLSGNAQYLTVQRMVSHGTILFDSDLEALRHALNPRQLRIESKAVQSIRAKVVNIRDWLPEMDMATFKRALLTGIFAGNTIPTYELDGAEWEKVQEMKAARYDSWEWNNGRSPRCTIHKKNGTQSLAIHLEHGCIQAIDVTGESAGSLDFTPVIGLRYQRQEIEKKLRAQHLNPTDMLNLLL